MRYLGKNTCHMSLENYIIKNLVTLHPDDTISKAKEKFKNHLFSHLPIVENKKLLGSLYRSDLATFEDTSKKINDYNYLYSPYSARESNTWTELLHLYATNQTNLLPVVSKNKEYLGCFDLNDILKVASETPFLYEEGIVLVLEKEDNSYTLSEITQIADINNAKLLGVFISQLTEKRSQITIKVKTENINEIIQSLRRYKYHVVSSHKEDLYINDLKTRSNYLQKYLNV